MREILFRGKTEQGEWVYGFYAELKNIDQSVKPHILFYRHGEEYDRESYCAEVVPSTVGQYTGLTDKNGTKIFEGDVLRRELKTGLVTDVRVMWLSEFGGWVLNGAGMLAQHNEITEVIGNIHESEVQE